MSVVAVSSQARKLPLRRPAAPSTQARCINLLSAPGPGREEQLPAGSRDRPPGRPAGQQREGRKNPRESAPGSRRGSACGTGRGGRRRVPAHPEAWAPPKAGARGPSRSPGDDKSLLAVGARDQKREGREFEDLPGLRSPWKRCGSLLPHGFERGPDVPASDRPAESPAGAHFQPRPRPAAPGQVRRVRSAGLFFCVRSTHDASTTGAGAQARVVAPSATPSPAAGAEEPEEGGKGSGLLTQTSEGRSACRGVWLLSGDPRADYGWPCVAKFKLSLPECLRRRRGAARLLQDIQQSGEAGTSGRRSDAPAGNAAGGRGVFPGRARPLRLRGKFSWPREGWCPGREQPRCIWAWLRRLQNALERSGPPTAQHWPRQGSPFWAGYQLGAEGGAEVVPAARCRQVHAAKPHAAPKPRVRPALAASVSPGDLEAGWGEDTVLLGPHRSAVPIPRPPRGRPRRGLRGTIALKLQ
uniref:Uncharacterized protein n=1 Tax=Papio anubis TaxID=9555 RepID=A0A8I5R078_PAPAN